VEDVVKTAVEPPRGIYPGRVDEKGRLKLPVDFQEFLKGIGELKVFATSFDERIGRLYPISAWKEIEKLLRNPGENAEDAEHLWFTAMDLGGDADMDDQGRVLLPSELRKALNIEKQPVHLEHYKGHINVFSETIYNERKAAARANRAAALKVFETRGLL
jgi:MraZ protein